MGTIFKIWDGYISGGTDNTVDLGSTALRFKNLYMAGSASFPVLTGSTLVLNGSIIAPVFQASSLIVNQTVKAVTFIGTSMILGGGISATAIIGSSLAVSGNIGGSGFYEATTSITSALTSTTYMDTILADGTFTIVLNSANSVSGKTLAIKNIGAGLITVDANGAETIDGDATKELAFQYSCMDLISDGSNWHIT